MRSKKKQKKNFFGAVWLRPLTNLEVPFGAGACTLWNYAALAALSGVESTVQR
jgi:hypothetical protein